MGGGLSGEDGEVVFSKKKKKKHPLPKPT